ncbi:hypothetical protein K435DRAFT_850853 [Dendrothele bispora CBS 962.96]|uniref:Uncharacterized protein n=1 Tax=Dendrothele bispora (strain CBS 962.96) TaxID=1314807 RepID=A0A4S8MQ20_DENBC|nr:hypothetical protein K435DRAFT_850853 [Dendrothele bispora CBS 962.96]
MPRGTTRSRSVGNATRGDVWGAFRGPSHGRGPFTSIYISTSPTLSRILLLNIAPPRRQDSSLKTHSMSRAGWKQWKGSGNTIVSALNKSKLGYRFGPHSRLNDFPFLNPHAPFRDRLCQRQGLIDSYVRREQILFMLLDEIVELQSIQKAFRAHVNRWKCEIGDNVP